MQEDALKYKKHATELNMNSYRQKKRIFYLKKNHLCSFNNI